MRYQIALPSNLFTNIHRNLHTFTIHIICYINLLFSLVYFNTLA